MDEQGGILYSVIVCLANEVGKTESWDPWLYETAVNRQPWESRDLAGWALGPRLQGVVWFLTQHGEAMDEMQARLPQPKRRRELLGVACFGWFSPREQLLQWCMVEASFCLLLPAQSECDPILQTLPESSFRNNLPTEGWLPSLMACAPTRNVGQFL